MLIIETQTTLGQDSWGFQCECASCLYTTWVFHLHLYTADLAKNAVGENKILINFH